MFLKILFLIIGWLITSYILSQFIIIARFARPFTRELIQAGAIAKKSLYKKFTITQCISISLTIITLILVIIIFPKYLISYLIGMTISFVMLLFQSGKNENNIQDYIRSYNNNINVIEILELIKSQI